ncbi:cytochrome P450 [Virgisporangium aurantiacum]|uniref:Cytochrome P450 n=1 Tax=Virgisporangium aurantiacum TaxID=175570 RepID=A0A8J3ZJU3_9ACTN|nr:cytochrome P450 [Virgisporangium aurantiacum]GIJ62783.1 cytochrome P450 [Virgisporangium aurantiacum]
MISRRLAGPDYLARLAELRGRHGGVFPGRSGQLYVADPAIARAVLGNAGGRFREHSDFFRIRGGTFGPRSAQIEVGRAVRQLLHRHHRASAGTLPELVDRHLVPTSIWPDAGNRLLFDYTRRVLVGADPSPLLLDTVREVVERAVLAGARDRYSMLARARFRARVMRVLATELAARRETGASEDLFDVLAHHAPPTTPNRDLAEVYLSGLFAMVGSVGFLFGWAMFLAATHGFDEPARVVREALRLWPVAWLFARRPAHAGELGGVAVTPDDDVRVCGYLVHRDPDHWSAPDEYRPERWATGTGTDAFIPFGWGPHACTGAAASLRIVESLVGIVGDRYRLDVTVTDPRPHVAAALAPPRFTLRLARTARTG